MEFGEPGMVILMYEYPSVVRFPLPAGVKVAGVPAVEVEQELQELVALVGARLVGENFEGGAHR